MALSDRIIVMSRSMIAQEGSPRDLYERPRDRFVASFMGEANLIKGRLIHSDGGLGRVVIGSIECVLPHRGLPEGEVEVAIRPQSIRLTRGLASASELPGRIVRAAYLGTYAEYVVATEVGELLVTTAEVALTVGDSTGVTLLEGEGGGS
jgi:iron(III) transport system ATP-binding protein